MSKKAIEIWREETEHLSWGDSSPCQTPCLIAMQRFADQESEAFKGGLKNCMGYALRFWEKEPSYRLYYNSGHVINSPHAIATWDINKPNWMEVEEYGYNYFKSAFDGLLDEHELELLDKYFTVK